MASTNPPHPVRQWQRDPRPPSESLSKTGQVVRRSWHWNRLRHRCRQTRRHFRRETFRRHRHRQTRHRRRRRQTPRHRRLRRQTPPPRQIPRHRRRQNRRHQNHRRHQNPRRRNPRHRHRHRRQTPCVSRFSLCRQPPSLLSPLGSPTSCLESHLARLPTFLDSGQKVAPHDSVERLGPSLLGAEHAACATPRCQSRTIRTATQHLLQDELPSILIA
mmetsp:Transcript_15356/g.31145  ORF Transcript_15356/g.31145 Transcript_15356/m.31145 type:complete len:217 (-) Transcript_15356:258-908(-)